MYRETTDANGQIPQIPVTPGTYTFKEVYAPDGYALNEAEMRFTIDADGNVTGDTTIRDDYTRFSLHKVDESGKPLSGRDVRAEKGGRDADDDRQNRRKGHGDV